MKCSTALMPPREARLVCAVERMVWDRLEVRFGDLVQSAVAPVEFETVQMGAVGASRACFEGGADCGDDLGECRHVRGRATRSAGDRPICVSSRRAAAMVSLVVAAVFGAPMITDPEGAVGRTGACLWQRADGSGDVCDCGVPSIGPLADEEADSAPLPERDAEIAVGGDLDGSVVGRADEQDAVQGLYL